MSNFSRSLRSICCGVLCLVLACTLLGQELSSWAVNAPPDTVQLVAVDNPMASTVRFIFKSISSKAIVVFLVAAPDGNMSGHDTFISGMGAVPPGGSLNATFGETDFNQRREVRISAIVYSDGSQVGSHKTLAMLDDRLLGEALEIKRASVILAASPDPSVAGLPEVRQKLGNLPAKAEDAVASVRGTLLEGVPQSYVDSRTSQPSYGLLAGVRAARQLVLTELGNKSSFAAMTPPTRSPVAQSAIREAQLHAVSDLAAKYQTLASQQAQIMRGVSQWSAQ